ncbi:MAG: hypothetical protein KC733_07990 [Candidatus Omnitrophica bacterium]|nr:hypothetical protein [Candidatus Omnitrophota bacterium]
MSINGILKEELANSLRLVKRYDHEIKKLPKGSLIKKNIRGYWYYYLIVREKGKVRFEYKGKDVSKEEIQQYAQAKKMRAKYRELRSKAKKQIRFLERALGEKKSI